MSKICTRCIGKEHAAGKSMVTEPTSSLDVCSYCKVENWVYVVIGDVPAQTIEAAEVPESIPDYSEPKHNEPIAPPVIPEEFVTLKDTDGNDVKVTKNFAEAAGAIPEEPDIDVVIEVAGKAAAEEAVDEIAELEAQADELAAKLLKMKEKAKK